jgi:hypothetical protein
MRQKSLHIFFLFSGLFACASLFSQTEQIEYSQMEVRNGDTILVTYSKEVKIHLSKKSGAKISKEYREYQRLQKYVKKVYPYAVLASQKLKEYEKDLAAAKSDHERRKIMKKVEKALVDKYGDELKNLTINQGKILLKLIDRETGHSSYELLSEMRGSFPAAIWQGLATLFDQNLKSKYDARGEDRDIEEIIIRIQRGQI